MEMINLKDLNAFMGKRIPNRYNTWIKFKQWTIFNDEDDSAWFGSRRLSSSSFSIISCFSCQISSSWDKNHCLYSFTSSSNKERQSSFWVWLMEELHEISLRVSSLPSNINISSTSSVIPNSDKNGSNLARGSLSPRRRPSGICRSSNFSFF